RRTATGARLASTRSWRSPSNRMRGQRRASDAGRSRAAAPRGSRHGRWPRKPSWSRPRPSYSPASPVEWGLRSYRSLGWDPTWLSGPFRVTLHRFMLRPSRTILGSTLLTMRHSRPALSKNSEKKDNQRSCRRGRAPENPEEAGRRGADHLVVKPGPVRRGQETRLGRGQHEGRLEAAVSFRSVAAPSGAHLHFVFQLNGETDENEDDGTDRAGLQ